MGYRKLQGLTGGYKGSQWATRCFIGLQGVTGSYKRLKSVTRG